MFIFSSLLPPPPLLPPLSPFLLLSESMDELTFKAGDLIMLKTRVGAEWLRGRLLSGEEGIFPKKFVEIVVSMFIGSGGMQGVRASAVASPRKTYHLVQWRLWYRAQWKYSMCGNL